MRAGDYRPQTAALERGSEALQDYTEARLSQSRAGESQIYNSELRPRAPRARASSPAAPARATWN